MKNRMCLFVHRLGHLFSKKGKEAMLFRDMDITRLVNLFQLVEKDKLKYEEKFCNNKTRTASNKSSQSKTSYKIRSFF